MRYTIILTPTAKSDIVNLKRSLEQRIIDTSFIRKELAPIYQKYLHYPSFLNDILL